MAVVEEARHVIAKIYEDYLNGLNSREIAAALNRENMLDRRWSRELVDYILTNERYAGNALLQKRYTTATLPKKQLLEIMVNERCSSSEAVIRRSSQRKHSTALSL